MNILKRQLAPISDSAWELINEEAKTIYGSLLSARKIVSVSKPQGWNYAGVPTGRLTFPEKGKNKVNYGLRQTKPLVEFRIPFQLDIWELDNIARGAQDVDLNGMEKAAKLTAEFEDSAIFYGLKNAQIKGLKNSSFYDLIPYPKKEEDLPKVIAQGINLLQSESFGGPYALIMGTEKWKNLTTCSQDYPLKLRLEEILNGPIIVSQNLDNAFLVPENSEDLLLTLGNDLSIGYESHNNEKVKLFFTESFTFQILDPKVIVALG